MAKGNVIIKEDICKGCELCVSVCPKKVLELSKTKTNSMGYPPAQWTGQDCIACGSCFITCPDVAITIEKID